MINETTITYLKLTRKSRWNNMLNKIMRSCNHLVPMWPARDHNDHAALTLKSLSNFCSVLVYKLDKGGNSDES